MPLNVRIERRRLAEARVQEVNARYMRKEQYDQLVQNIRDDGCLTSVPLWYQPEGQDVPDIVSGHHRGQAAIEALGPDVEADVMIVLDEQSLSEIRARQISHNAIAGEDDLATLKQMYDQIDDVDWRAYTGLDDKTLELMAQVDLSSLAEANLDFQTVQIAFLPPELEQAQRAFAEATKLVTANPRWLATFDQYVPTLQAIESARASYSIGNIATALGIILDVFEAHLGDLQAGWLDEHDTVLTDKWVPIESVAGTRALPPDAAGIIVQAMKKARKDADLANDAPLWQGLELLAADYLAGA